MAEPKSFDTIDFDWKPTQSYAESEGAQLVATVATQETLRGSTEVNFTQPLSLHLRPRHRDDRQ